MGEELGGSIGASVDELLDKELWWLSGYTSCFSL